MVHASPRKISNAGKLDSVCRCRNVLYERRGSHWGRQAGGVPDTLECIGTFLCANVYRNVCHPDLWITRRKCKNSWFVETCCRIWTVDDFALRIVIGSADHQR